MNGRKFKAAVFAPPEPALSRPGSVSFPGSSIRVEMEDGRVFDIFYSTSRVELGGFDGTNLVISGRTADFQDVQVHITEPAVFDEEEAFGNIEFYKSILSLRKHAKIRQRYASLLLPGLLTFTALVFLLFYLFFGQLVDRAVSWIPASWENMLGEAAALEFLKVNGQIKNEELASNMNLLFEKLVRNISDTDYRFELFIVKNSQVNAFALPGGKIFVNTGLIEKAENAEEVAGVMAHEIAHVIFRHGLRRIVGSLGSSALFFIFIGDSGSLIELTKNVALTLHLSSFDRSQETEADLTAVDLLIKARINPEPFVKFFERMEKQEGFMEKSLGYFSSHPPSGERARKVRDYIAGKGRIDYEPLKIELVHGTR